VAAVTECDDPERRHKVLVRGYVGAGGRMARWLDSVRLADQLLNQGGPASDAWRDLLEVAGAMPLERSFGQELDGELARAAGVQSKELKGQRKKVARNPAPLLLHPEVKADRSVMAGALVAPDSPLELWGALKTATAGTVDRQNPWPDAEARILGRLSEVLLVMGWTGALSDRTLLDQVADAFALAGDDPDPEAIARRVLGDARVQPVLDYRPSKGTPFDPPAIPGMGVLLLYRPGGFAGNAVPVVASLGREVVGAMMPGTYTWVYLPTGPYSIEAKTEAKDTLDFTIRDGEMLQVRAQIVMGVMVGRPRFDRDESLSTVLDATARWTVNDPGWWAAGAAAPAVSVR
jgi:hypothetical protein